jgi:molybdopterin molybdotransferase
MISVAEARRRIIEDLTPLGVETVALAEGLGRVLATDVRARLTQPPADLSAMDGYAVRADDVSEPPVTLRVVGHAPAGGAYGGTIGPGEAVRIFTGGPLPRGADTIVIQEDTEADGDNVTVRVGAPVGTYVRPAGLDYRAGDVGVPVGRRVTVRDVALSASMNTPWLRVRRRPRVAVLATGDELVMPGDPVGANQIVSSNNIGLCAFVRAAGGEAIDLGIALDNAESLQTLAAGARGADMLVTVGGASVGDHDLVQSVLGDVGLDIDFWRIAMRPGKPLMFGRFGTVPMLGLPGNPVSALVCSLVFLGPALARLQGLAGDPPSTLRARLGRDLAANDRREDYLRAALTRDDDGEYVATPFDVQDSSMLSRLAHAKCLVIRAPHAPAAPRGSTVEAIPFPAGF